MKDIIIITIDPERLNPELGATNVTCAMTWAAAQVVKADTELDNATERFSKAVDVWDMAESPSAEVENEYHAAWVAYKKAAAVKDEYSKLLKTLTSLEMNLLHLDWAMDDNNY